MSAVPQSHNDPAALIRRDLGSASVRAQLQAALPEHVTVDKFCRVVMTAVQSNYLLLQADRMSLLKSCMEAAADGLLPDGREGAIVPYRDRKANRVTAQWQPMVWGLVKLVRQSGELRDIGVEIVRESDKFERWIDEDGPHFKHTPSLTQEGAPIGVYSYARTKDGGFYIEYMSWAEIEKFRALSKAKSDDGPWSTWTEEMAKVRPIKRLCKRLPMSTDAIDAFRRDDARDAALVAAQVVDPVAAMNARLMGAADGAQAPQIGHGEPVTLPQRAAHDDDAALVDSEQASGLDAAEHAAADAPEPPPFTFAKFVDLARVTKTLDEADELASLITAYPRDQQPELSEEIGRARKRINSAAKK